MARIEGVSKSQAGPAVKLVYRFGPRVMKKLTVLLHNPLAPAFYQHFGFIPFPDRPRRLTMSVATAKANLP